MRSFKRFTLTAALLLLVSARANAESPVPAGNEGVEHRGQGYVFFAPGGILAEETQVGTAHFGGGGEFLLYKGIGIGSEAGYLTPWRNFSNGIGLVSVNGSYHFLRNGKVSPFVTAGYSVAFRSGHVNLVNFGGGINWWVRERIGIRLEVRDNMYSESPFDGTHRIHYLGGRIGLSFR